MPPLLDPWAAILAAMSVLFGAGGIWTLLAAKATARANRDVAEATAAAANQQAATADWTGLMAYWQVEMAALRTTGAQLEVRVLFLERQRDEDLAFIDALEEHIWRGMPPPPPTRRRTTPTEET